MNITTVFTMIVVAAALTCLYLRFGVTTTKFTAPSDRAHRNFGDPPIRSTTYEYYPIDDDGTANTLYATDHLEREKNEKNRFFHRFENNRRFDVLPDPASIQEPKSDDRSTVENAQKPDGRSLQDTISARIRPEMSKTTHEAGSPTPLLLFGLRSESTNNNHTDDDQMLRYRQNKRPNSDERDLKEKHHSTTTRGKLMMNPDYDSWCSYQNEWCSPSNNVQGDFNHKENEENPAHGTGVVIPWRKLEPGSSGTGEEIREIPPYSTGPGHRYPGNNYAYHYTTPPPVALRPNSPTTMHYKHNHTLDWRKIGSLVLIKLGYLKVLFVIWCKFVFVVKLTFFKLQAIRNVTDIFNSLPMTVAIKWFTTTVIKLLTTPGLVSSNSTMTLAGIIPPGHNILAVPQMDPRPSRFATTIVPNSSSNNYSIITKKNTKLVTAGVSWPNTSGRTTRSGSGIRIKKAGHTSHDGCTSHDGWYSLDGRIKF